MTEEEKNELIDRINSYWKNRPKMAGNDEKKKLIPVHEFDNLDFSDPEHVKAVREYYENRENSGN